MASWSPVRSAMTPPCQVMIRSFSIFQFRPLSWLGEMLSCDYSYASCPYRQTQPLRKAAKRIRTKLRMEKSPVPLCHNNSTVPTRMAVVRWCDISFHDLAVLKSVDDKGA